MTATAFDEAELVEHVTGQRWFGSKTRDVTGAHPIDTVVLPSTTERVVLALVEVRFDTGMHDVYQVLGAERDGRLSLDVLGDPAVAYEIVRLIGAGATEQGAEGAVEFTTVPGATVEPDPETMRAIEAEQSNTSLVFGDELIFKAYRRLEAGINPELELMRFLTEHGFRNSPALIGWYEYVGRPLEATLGVLQAFVPGGIDGFDLALDELGEDPDRFLRRLGRLGQVTGEMHTVLGSEADDPAFAPEEPSTESLGLLTATIDEEIERIFSALPDDPALAPIAGRKQDVRERLMMLSQVGAIGRVIRQHGDYHLGQALWADDDWTVIDFEGEPARSLADRRRKRSPLRDVAGMLRSFAYAASASRIQRRVEPPGDWEARARAEFLGGYLETVDPNLLPAGEDAIMRLLAIFELEKAVYELRYELDHRPDWLSIPVAGIERLLNEVE
ncbi:MAG TPA: phosphotransferase [Actinomycetospora sp.]|uniref:phosphotransferase n=1 Tax=Actinomycetospora sp. TaxID=1872135 RepID=UPI002F40BAE6